jgi:hypothetical protein
MFHRWPERYLENALANVLMPGIATQRYETSDD